MQLLQIGIISYRLPGCLWRARGVRLPPRRRSTLAMSLPRTRGGRRCWRRPRLGAPPPAPREVRTHVAAPGPGGARGEQCSISPGSILTAVQRPKKSRMRRGHGSSTSSAMCRMELTTAKLSTCQRSHRRSAGGLGRKWWKSWPFAPLSTRCRGRHTGLFRRVRAEVTLASARRGQQVKAPHYTRRAWTHRAFPFCQDGSRGLSRQSRCARRTGR